MIDKKIPIQIIIRIQVVCDVDYSNEYLCYVYVNLIHYYVL